MRRDETGEIVEGVGHCEFCGLHVTLDDTGDAFEFGHEGDGPCPELARLDEPALLASIRKSIATLTCN